MPLKVDHEKCTGCGTCVEVCPADPVVFEIREGKSHVVHPEACMECQACVESCPEGAISME